MRDLIVSKLRQIENNYDVKVILAVESGSRAWGFASPDSDYDVRFIYVRPKKDYLRLEDIRDVIELPINEDLDINGWDLQKALKLLYRSNPTLFEWFSSPIVYMEKELAKQFRDIMADYFSIKKSLYHYLSTAERNYRVYLKGEMVKAKKYFYVLRPILACQWVLDKGTPPPVLFSELADAELPEFLQTEVNRILDLKINSPEIKEIAQIDTLNDYFDKSFVSIKERISKYPEHRNNWNELNLFFTQAIDMM